MVTDRRSGHEIIDCIQAFLESRQRALQKSKVRSRTRRAQEESQSSEFSEMGIDFEDDDLFALDGGDLSPKAGMDAQVAQVRDRATGCAAELWLTCAHHVRFFMSAFRQEFTK